MKIKIQLVIETETSGDTDQPPVVVEEIFELKRVETEFSPQTLGEAQELLAGVQQTLVTRQAREYLNYHQKCPECGIPYSTKGQHELVFRSLFGKFKLSSPRFYRCQCQAPHSFQLNAPSSSTQKPSASFSPLAAALTERNAPELVYLEAKWASLISYGLTGRLLADLLPTCRTVSKAVLTRKVQSVGQRLESELSEELPSVEKTIPRPWDKLAATPAPLIVGIDGGYIHAYKARESKQPVVQTETKPETATIIEQKIPVPAAVEATPAQAISAPPPPKAKEETGNWFEVIVGKSLPEEKDAKNKCFGFVNNYDTKAKQKVYQVLKSQGMQPNQPVIFMADGGDTVRQVQFSLNLQTEGILDWFHITMRLTVLKQLAKGLVVKPKASKPQSEEDEDEGSWPSSEEVESTLQQIKWKVWHGQVFAALERLEWLLMDLEVWEDQNQVVKKLCKGVREMSGYLKANRNYLVNYGERYRNGERISTGFVESTVNQLISRRFVKKQQMKWRPRGAHLLLQVRVKVVDDELHQRFCEWYSGMQPLKTEIVEEKTKQAA